MADLRTEANMTVLPFPTQLDVVIVGAGPTGLVLDHELGRDDISVVIFEKRTWRQRRSGSARERATLEVCADLGIADEAGARPKAVRGASRGRGRVVRRGFTQRNRLSSQLRPDCAPGTRPQSHPRLFSSLGMSRRYHPDTRTPIMKHAQATAQ